LITARLPFVQRIIIELYLHQQGLDTTTPAGKAMFQMMGVFAEFERAMIVDRVKSGMCLAKLRGTKSGRPIGRPRVPQHTREVIQTGRAASECALWQSAIVSALALCSLA
jgi:DNA invertase Pin-like site-specific DNA recombinase